MINGDQEVMSSEQSTIIDEYFGSLGDYKAAKLEDLQYDSYKMSIDTIINEGLEQTRTLRIKLQNVQRMLLKIAEKVKLQMKKQYQVQEQKQNFFFQYDSIKQNALKLTNYSKKLIEKDEKQWSKVEFLFIHPWLMKDNSKHFQFVDDDVQGQIKNVPLEVPMIKIPKEDIDKKKHKRYREPNVKNKDILLMPNNNI